MTFITTMDNDKLLNIAYCHSKVCEAIVWTEHSTGRNEFDGVIYGRNFKGFFPNSLYLPEDHIVNDAMLLSYALLISRYFEIFDKNKNIRIFIPHFNLPLFRLLTYHHRVAEVYYIEEGDLSYEPHELVNSSHVIENELPLEITKALQTLGFDMDNKELSIKNWTNWFYDCYGLFKGCLCASELAFPVLGGEKRVINLPKLHLLNKESALIFLTDINQLATQVQNELDNIGIHSNLSYIQNILCALFCNYINDYCANNDGKGKSIYLKSHPGNNFFQNRIISNNISPKITLWENTDFDYLTRRHELGCVNFHDFYSVGNSSVLRYAQLAWGEESTFEFVHEKIIINTVIKIITIESKQ